MAALAELFILYLFQKKSTMLNVWPWALASDLQQFTYCYLIKQYEMSLSQMLNDILWPDNIQWQQPTDQTLYRTRPFTEFLVVSIEHLRRVWHADRGRLLLRTPGPIPLGLAYVLLVEINPFPKLSLFYRTMLFEYPSVLSRFCFKINYGILMQKRNIGICVPQILSIVTIAVQPVWYLQ